MSATEILVILFGLYVGYWVVSRLFTDNAKEPGRSGSQREPEQSASMEHDSAPLNWYETLNVPPHATVEDIRQAYKVLMHQYHPDKVASLGDELKALAERKSKEITNAYRQALQLRGEGS